MPQSSPAPFISALTSRALASALLCAALAAGCITELGCSPAKKSAEPPQAPPSPPEASGLISTLAPGEPTSPVAVELDDARLGAADADVTVVAFLDFQCGFCAQGFNVLKQLREGYTGRELRIVFKHLPLEFHEMALPAAIAGQAVMQGAGSEAFFDYATLAFENQSSLSYASLGDIAERAGLDRDQYNEIVGQEEVFQRVVQDARLAHQLGVDATPAFFVNGRLIAGAQPIEYFRKVIGEELMLMRAEKGRSWKAAYQKRVTENMRGSVLAALLANDPEDYRVPVDGSATLGSPDAPVTIAMFTDFECPYCKRAEITLGLLKKKYGKKLRIVFKHLPLPFHDSARPASLLAEAVHQHHGDEAFFAATAQLFHSSPDLSRTTLEKIGKKHGLSKQQIDDALTEKNKTLVDRLERDSDLADDVLARGTPHFFINGKRLSGARPVEQFEALINHELRRANGLKEKGVSSDKIYEAVQEDALSPGVPQRIEVAIPEDGRPVQGGSDRPVTIHVFSDFECPHCRQGESLLEELGDIFPGKLRIVWHDFPLDFHDRARPAARAGREAWSQRGNDGFWRMHSLLFNDDGDAVALSTDEILAHGKALGLDVAKLRAALDSEVHDEAINRDIELGESLGIRGTPAYVVEGYLVTGVKPLRFLERLVERSLAEGAKPSSSGQ